MVTELSGFLLTRHWRDTPTGVEISFWAWTPEGALRLLFPHQRSVCFLRRDALLPAGSDCERKPLALTDLDGNPVDGLYFHQQNKLQRLREQRLERGVMLLESDIKPTDRFLMERFITAGFIAQGTLTRQPGGYEMINARMKPATVQPALRYLSLDIESDGTAGEILSIAWCGQGNEAILIQGEHDDWPSDLPLHWYADEAALLRGFLHAFAQIDPDLILGWNLINFDLDHLQRRCQRLHIPFQLGRGGELAAILQPQQSGQQRIASIPGRVALDGIDSLRAAFWSFPSFSLNHVAQQLLGRRKMIDDGKEKMLEIRRLYHEDRPALAAYNLEDCRLVEAIFSHTDLIDFALQRALMTGLSLGRQGGSVAAFDNLYLPRLHRKGVVACDVGAHHFHESSPGGYVMESQPGIYDNVLVLDFKSLYPSIIRTFHIDPFGMARPGDDAIPGFLGARFSRTQSILPEIITDLWRQRDRAKQEQNNALSQAVKIIMNSFYGVLGSGGCRFYDPQLASSITRRGHQIITRSRDWLEQQGYRVIYGDTDSLFVLLGAKFSEDQSIATGRMLAQQLNRWWDEQLQREFKLESLLEIEFETHFIRFLMPTIRGAETGSKKRYAGSLRNRSGELELRFKGLESVRSDWTPLAQNFQRELYRRVFFGQPYREYVRATAKALNAGELDAQLVYRKRLRRRLDEYRRNLPPHVQAARKAKKVGRWVSYLITVNGPEPLDNLHSAIDYQHYADAQLAPAADGILHFVGDSFERLTANQLNLF
ncbi:MAG: DNA polymerase II [Gammaproteobacteria bacterium]|nr:DNA polymerase II [Gammaproteobacteria bacterium]